jgi:diguanylate cyclase (GGDEF)-like protein/PAS domain S-box-containing protein
MFGTIQDITDRKLAEEQLTILKEAVECLPIGITITDIDGKIIFTNPAEAEIHGYAREELFHKEACILASPKLRSTFPARNFEKVSFWKRESINIRKNGSEFPVHLTSIPVRNTEGRYLGFVTACEDITERKAAERKIQQLAYYDLLTNLPNRRMFQDRLRQSLARAEREGLQTAVLFLDLDRFKDVNDAFGHEFGDRLLQAVARRLQKWLRKADTVARLGGDEFVILLTEIDDQKKVAYTAERILESFSRPFDLRGRQIYSSTSIGIAMYPADGENVDELVKNADAAMYHAKSKGKQTYCFFSEKLNRKICERISLETDLRNALEEGELVLNYQPQIGLCSGRMIGVEALVRWQCPKRGLLEPDQFVAVAEETGLIYRLGEWVLRTACAQVERWRQSGHWAGKVAVNISGYQFKRADFTEKIDAILKETGLEPACLELEFTESVIMDKAAETISKLNNLKARGIHLSIDDFGTGCSSLSYLKHFPIDRIKIDRAFVREVITSGDDAAIVDAVIAMARRLNIKVLAEGVETEEQLNFLKKRRCDEAQGYYFSRPLKAEDLTRKMEPGATKEPPWDFFYTRGA